MTASGWDAPLRFSRAITLAACMALPCVSEGADAVKPKELARGRYLVMTSGCNDCHTAGYGPSGGKVPEAQWLTGDSLGRGPACGRSITMARPPIELGRASIRPPIVSIRPRATASPIPVPRRAPSPGRETR